MHEVNVHVLWRDLHKRPGEITYQPSFSQTGCLVRLVLQEAKAPVLLLVIGRTVDDDFLEAS